MAKLNSLTSTISNLLKKVYNPPALSDDDFYTVNSESSTNGMQSNVDPEDQYAELDYGYKAGVHGQSSKSDPVLSPEEIEQAELDFQKKIKKFCEEREYDFQRSLLAKNFKINDKSGNEVFTVKSSGDVRYTGTDEGEYKAMMQIAAGQFSKNKRTAYPFVREDDPSIPDSKQKALLIIAIDALIEQKVPLKRIKIKSKKWAHLMDDYALKQQEEFKQVKPIDLGGIDSGKPEPNITKVESFGTIGKFEEEKAEKIAETVIKSPETVASETPREEAKASPKREEGLTLKPVVNKDYTPTLQGELFLAMQNSGGAMFKLLGQTENFAKRNFEIRFSNDGELVSVSHVRPVEDGKIHVLTFPLDKLENGRELKEGVGLYHNRQEQLEKDGNLRSVLKDVVSKSSNYLDFKDLVEAKKAEGIEIGFTVDNRNLHAKRIGETEEYAQISLKGQANGVALVKDKISYDKGEFPYDIDLAKTFEPAKRKTKFEI